MWVCLNNAFLSVVSKDCAADELLVRARRAGDIERVFPTAVVRQSSTTDYRYRAVVKRDTVAAAMVAAVKDLDYANFKDSVDDDELYNAYSSVWSVMGRLQPGGPYGHYPKSLSLFDKGGL